MDLGTYNNSRTSIIFLGTPLIDLSIRVPHDVLDKYKLQGDNAYILNEKTKPLFDEINRYNPTIQIGGSVTNSARVFRKLSNIKRVEVVYLGSIGLDEYGQLIREQIKLEGITELLIEVDNQKTGTVVVLIEGRKRTLITDLGASKCFPSDILKQSEVARKVESSKYVYISAFFIRISFDVIQTLIKDDKKNVIINLGAQFLCNAFKDEISYMYKYADVIIGNESEHRELAKEYDIKSQDLTEAILKTNDCITTCKRHKIIIATRGDKSVIVIEYSNDHSNFTEYPIQTLSPDKIVDTNGAGDAFVGGFLSGYVAGNSITNCVEIGNKAATQMIQIWGFDLNKIQIEKDQ